MTDIRNVHIQCAPHRGALYKCFAEILSYPVEPLYLRWRNGELKQQLAAWLGELPFTFDWNLAHCDMPDVTEWASEYMRMFELPVDGQPCPLYGGIYASSRREVMEELLRYYHFFGLTTQGAAEGDLPDSIPTLLEFMQFLAFRESVSDDQEITREARKAQKDLLERHLTRWIPPIRAQLEGRNPLAFYTNALDLLDKFINHEVQLLAGESAAPGYAAATPGAQS